MHTTCLTGGPSAMAKPINPNHHTIEDLKAIKAEYRAKIKDLKGVAA